MLRVRTPLTGYASLKQKVYPLSTRHLEAENTLLDQSDRSTQIVLSIGPICLGLALSSSSFQRTQNGSRCLLDLVPNKSYSFRLFQEILK